MGQANSASNEFDRIWDGDDHLSGFSRDSIKSTLFWLANGENTPAPLLGAVQEVADNPGSRILREQARANRLLLGQVPPSRKHALGAVFYAATPDLNNNQNASVVHANVWVNTSRHRAAEEYTAVGRRIVLAALSVGGSQDSPSSIPVERSTQLHVVSNVALSVAPTYGELSDTVALETTRELLPEDVFLFLSAQLRELHEQQAQRGAWQEYRDSRA